MNALLENIAKFNYAKYVTLAKITQPKVVTITYLDYYWFMVAQKDQCLHKVLYAIQEYYITNYLINL